MLAEWYGWSAMRHWDADDNASWCSCAGNIERNLTPCDGKLLKRISMTIRVYDVIIPSLAMPSNCRTSTSTSTSATDQHRFKLMLSTRGLWRVWVVDGWRRIHQKAKSGGQWRRRWITKGGVWQKMTRQPTEPKWRDERQMGDER